MVSGSNRITIPQKLATVVFTLCNDASIEAVEHVTVEIGHCGCSLECRVAMS